MALEHTPEYAKEAFAIELLQDLVSAASRHPTIGAVDVIDALGRIAGEFITMSVGESDRDAAREKLTARMAEAPGPSLVAASLLARFAPMRLAALTSSLDDPGRDLDLTDEQGRALALLVQYPGWTSRQAILCMSAQPGITNQDINALIDAKYLFHMWDMDLVTPTLKGAEAAKPFINRGTRGNG